MVRFAVARKMSSSRPSSSAIVRASRSRATPASGSSPQAFEMPEGAHGVALLAAGGRPDRTGHLDRLATAAFGLPEQALEHPDLGERGEDERPLAGRLGRDELDGPAMGDDRPLLVARGPPIATEPLVEERQRDAVGPLVEAGDGRFGERRGAGRPARGEGVSAGPGEQAGRGPSGRPATPRDRPVVELEGELEVGQRVARRVDRLGQRRRPRSPPIGRARARGRARWCRAREPGPRSEPGGERRVMPAALGRQEVGLDGPGDELVAEADRRLGRQRRGGTSASAPDRSVGHARADVAIEDDEPVLQASTRPTARSGSRMPPPRRGAALERGAGRSALRSKAADAAASSSIRSGSPAGASSRRIAPAFRRPLGEPGHDQLLERAGQRRTGELATGGQELLGDERVAPRSLGHQKQDRGRRALALDRLDELGELVPIEWLERQLGRRIGPVGHLGQRRPERMAVG